MTRVELSLVIRDNELVGFGARASERRRCKPQNLNMMLPVLGI